MTAESTPIGSLAKALHEARVDLWVVEQRVDQLIESVFPDWRPRFPTSAGWQFTPPDGIDVYSVVPSPAAVAALRRAGFLVVILHEHDAGKLLTCTCRPEP